MAVNRILVSLLVLFFFSYPYLDNWTFGQPALWYRPWLVWLLGVGVLWWVQRDRDLDEL